MDPPRLSHLAAGTRRTAYSYRHCTGTSGRSRSRRVPLSVPQSFASLARPARWLSSRRTTLALAQASRQPHRATTLPRQPCATRQPCAAPASCHGSRVPRSSLASRQPRAAPASAPASSAPASAPAVYLCHASLLPPPCTSRRTILAPRRPRAAPLARAAPALAPRQPRAAPALPLRQPRVPASWPASRRTSLAAPRQSRAAPASRRASLVALTGNARQPHRLGFPFTSTGHSKPPPAISGSQRYCLLSTFYICTSSPVIVLIFFARPYG